MSRNHFQKRKDQVKEITDQMNEAIDSYFETPEQMKEYLNYMGKFYMYSPRNSALITKQFSGAKAVGSFKFWKDNGFHVKKGEKGIKILVPNKTAPRFKDKDGKWKNVKYATKEQKDSIKKGKLEKQNSRLYFSVGNVFDVSQTNAKASDLPDIFPNRWMEGKVRDYDAMRLALNQVGKQLDVSIGAPFEELGSAKGAFYYAVNQKGKGHIGLNPRNGELQNIKTLMHELAHARLHHKDHENHLKLSDSEKEFQAEMTAYTVASYFGIDTSDYSLKYLAHWTKGRELNDKSKLLAEVRETSVKFIETIEKELMLEKDNTIESSIEIKNKEDLRVVSKSQPEIYANKKSYLLIEYGNFGQMKSKEINQADVVELKMDFKEDIEYFNEVHKEKYTLIDPETIKEPSVIVKWSESSSLKSNDILPFGEANHTMAKIANDQKGNLGYLKTWYTVVAPNAEGKIDVIATNRIDLGDGYYDSLFEQLLKESNLSNQHIETMRNQIINSKDKVIDNYSERKEPNIELER